MNHVTGIATRHRRRLQRQLRPVSLQGQELCVVALVLRPSSQEVPKGRGLLKPRRGGSVWAEWKVSWKWCLLLFLGGVSFFLWFSSGFSMRLLEFSYSCVFLLVFLRDFRVCLFGGVFSSGFPICFRVFLRVSQVSGPAETLQSLRLIVALFGIFHLGLCYFCTSLFRSSFGVLSLPDVTRPPHVPPPAKPNGFVNVAAVAQSPCSLGLVSLRKSWENRRTYGGFFGGSKTPSNRTVEQESTQKFLKKDHPRPAQQKPTNNLINHPKNPNKFHPFNDDETIAASSEIQILETKYL